MAFALVLLASYLLGAIPIGFLLGKIRGVDLTEYGSGKIGFANAWRTLGIKLAIVVFAGDLLKGVVAVLIARFFLDSDAAQMAAGFAAVAGHNWSVYIKFRGGRGVNTSVGALLAMSPLAGSIGLGVFFVLLGLTRYISVASMVGAVAGLVAMVTLWAAGSTPVEFLVYTAVAVGLILFQHRENVARLMSGTEPKMGSGGVRRQAENES